MRTLHRIAVPLINAFFVTTTLLYLMFYLVRIEEPSLSSIRIQAIPPFTGELEEPEVKTKISRPPKAIEPTVTPELPTKTAAIEIDPFEGPSLDPGYKPRVLDELTAPLNNQLVLALGYPPVYPNVAIRREIEGYAMVGFSVSSSGTVYDAFVIESEPDNIFNRSALKAISKFKYKAKMVDGKPVATSGQRYLFRYELDAR